MKQNEIASLLIIALVTGVLAYFIANAVIGSPDNNPVQVEKVTPIQSSFPNTDERVFNEDAIDPTVEISGDNPQSDAPFSDD